MKVLLLVPPTAFEDKYGEYERLGPHHPPVNLLLLGSSLKSCGHEVRIIDYDLEYYERNKFLQVIHDFMPDLIGFSIVTMNIDSAHECARMVKEMFPNIITLIGGHHLSVSPFETMNECCFFDYGLKGECENTICAFAECLESKNYLKVKEIEGVVFRENGRVIVDDRMPIIENMDALPFPDFSLINGYLFKYMQSVHQSCIPSPFVYLVFTRGCPYQCNFCSHLVGGQKLRHYSVEYSIKIIKHLSREYKIKGIVFGDELFVAHRSFAINFCHRMIQEKLNNIKWTAATHIHSIDTELIDLMRKAGCVQIYFGLESGSSKILKNLNKKINLDEAEQKSRIIRSRNMSTAASFMIGCPGESLETLKETYRFLKKTHLDYMFIWYFTPLPGTFYWDRYKDFGKMINFDRRNLSESNLVFIPQGLSEEIIRRYQRKWYRGFYFHPRRIWKQLCSLKNFHELVRNLYALKVLWGKKG